MALWIRGGGEQTVCPSASGAGKRTYYAEDELTPYGSFVQDQEKRRRLHSHTDDTEKISNLKNVDSHDDAHTKYLISRQPVDTPIPECDIPYRSIEPRDSPTPGPPEDKEQHIFYVLYEEGFESTAGRLQLRDRLREIESHSSLPPAVRDDLYPALSAPKYWANGAHLRTSDMEDPYYASSPTPAHPYGTPPQWARYEDWRERNCAYDMAADQEEESRSFSPFVVLPPPAEYRHTPEISIASATSHLKHQHSSRDIRRPDDRDDFEPAYDYESSLGRPQDRASHARHCPTDDANLLVAGSHPPVHHEARPPSPPGGGNNNNTVNGYDNEDDAYFISDDQAADNVTAHLAGFRRRYPTSRKERILRSLIHPKSGSGVADFELDDDALTNIMCTANDLFFGGRLENRVQWDWSNKNSDPQYDCKIIGHTSLRVKKDAGGIETFVLLSTPILKNRAYSRRLLISAFLHELIHCYLFICCGWKARKDGGHTDGFRRIANTIDQWAGRDNLFLCQVEADLEQFRQAPLPLSYVLDQSHHVCRPAEHYSDQGHQSEHGWWTRHQHHEWV